MNEVLTPYYLHFAAFIFSAGLYVVLTKRSSIFVLIGVELILNAGNLVMVVFSRMDSTSNGQLMAVFSVVLTVCEVSIALAILLNLYRKHSVSSLNDLNEVGNE